jgi:repressor LexA
MTTQDRSTPRPLSPKEISVLQFIESFIDENGYSPTFTEIRDNFKFASVNSVQNYIKQLSFKGYISVPGSNLKRAIEIINRLSSSPHNSNRSSKNSSVSIPLLGSVAAGKPIEVRKHNEFTDVPRSLVKSPKNSFSLRVVGDSMIDDGILDGDLILVQEQVTANNGETVVVVINEEATLKKFFNPTPQSAGCVELRPSNSQMSSFWFKPSEISIKGKLIGLIRKF